MIVNFLLSKWLISSCCSCSCSDKWFELIFSYQPFPYRYLVCLRLSSSTEQSSSSQLMRRHKRRRRRHKLAKIDRVRPSETIHWPLLRKEQMRHLLIKFVLILLFLCISSLHPSAVSLTPRWASTSSLSHSTWVKLGFMLTHIWEY